MLWWLMSILAYGSLVVGVVVAVYSTLAISGEISELEERSKNNE